MLGGNYMKKVLFDFKVADIVEIAILCSLAIVLDTFVKIPLGPSGSINLSMVPILVIALRHGWFKTLFAGGLVYGLITCLLDGYGIITYPLDYFLGFGSTAVLGLFAEYINKNYRRRITVSELADRVHLSERQVARIIRQEYRCSFTELLNNRRLANAVSMLKNTNLSIAQIIERTFYCSPNYFYRVFRKKYGISPLQYRKQIRTPYAGNMVIDQN